MPDALFQKHCRDRRGRHFAQYVEQRFSHLCLA
jgi:hypothetical protein